MSFIAVPRADALHSVIVFTGLYEAEGLAYCYSTCIVYTKIEFTTTKN